MNINCLISSPINVESFQILPFYHWEFEKQFTIDANNLELIIYELYILIYIGPGVTEFNLHIIYQLR